MYQLLVKSGGWCESEDTISESRVYMDEDYKLNGIPNKKLTSIPALFVPESQGNPEKKFTKIGYINHISKNNKDIKLKYNFDNNIPQIPNSELEKILDDLDISKERWGEINHTHWTIKKDVDLFQVLYRYQLGLNIKPKLFSIESIHQIDDNLISVMMPFSNGLNKVYKAIENIVDSFEMQCQRADNIWDNDIIINDIVSLICRSRIIICDCTDKNPNVFYEMGISHTLGKNTILITQDENPPFDVKHIRYISYKNDTPGIEKLAEELKGRIKTITQKG